MFKQLFRSMNDALDDILLQLPAASGPKRTELEDRVAVLKAMSDTCIEEWLLFEEKLGQLAEQPSPGDTASAALKPKPEQNEPIDPLHPSCHTGVKKTAEPLPPQTDKGETPREEATFARGQGFYKLGMFAEAVTDFEKVVYRQPDLLLARIYLAMSYLRSGEYAEAYRHFQFLIPLTDDVKMKAISYNAMGCIQAEKQNMDKALEYFRLAHSADPASIEPVLNMKEWSKRN